jgi:hypothetical protein
MTWRNYLVSLTLLVSGCASYSGAGLVPGQSMVEDVQAVMGEPTAVKDTKDGERVLWYSKLPNGRESYAARIDPNGVLVSLEQRLTEENVAKLQPNVTTSDELFDLLGPPYRRFKYPLKDLEAWEYQLRTSPELRTLYVDVSPDHVVRNVYQLHDRDMRGGRLGMGFGGFSFGF